MLAALVYSRQSERFTDATAVGIYTLIACVFWRRVIFVNLGSHLEVESVLLSSKVSHFLTLLVHLALEELGERIRVVFAFHLFLLLLREAKVADALVLVAQWVTATTPRRQIR